MLNPDRIVLMTKMAAYEEGEGKKNMSIGKYFRSDYISVQLMKSVVCGTISFLVGLALYILYNIETFMQDIYKIDLLAFAKQVLTYYAIMIVAYVVISYAIYSYRYAKAKKNLKQYYQNLKKLNSMY